MVKLARFNGPATLRPATSWVGRVPRKVQVIPLELGPGPGDDELPFRRPDVRASAAEISAALSLMMPELGPAVDVG